MMLVYLKWLKVQQYYYYRLYEATTLNLDDLIRFVKLLGIRYRCTALLELVN